MNDNLRLSSNEIKLLNALTYYDLNISNRKPKLRKKIRKRLPLLDEFKKEGWMTAKAIKKLSRYKGSATNIYSNMIGLIEKSLVQEKMIEYRDLRNRPHKMKMFRLYQGDVTKGKVYTILFNELNLPQDVKSIRKVIDRAYFGNDRLKVAQQQNKFFKRKIWRYEEYIKLNNKYIIEPLKHGGLK